MKKTLPVGLIVVILLVALAMMGIAYGYWTDQVQINGSVQSGNLNVEWTNFWYSDTNCTYVMDPTNHTLTITGTNAIPSLDAFHGGAYWCEAMVQVKNTGTIPVTLSAPIVTKTGPNYWTIYPLAAQTLAPGATTADGVQIEFLIPASETANEGATSTITITVDAAQVP